MINVLLVEPINNTMFYPPSIIWYVYDKSQAYFKEWQKIPLVFIHLIIYRPLDLRL